MCQIQTCTWTVEICFICISEYVIVVFQLILLCETANKLLSRRRSNSVFCARFLQFLFSLESSLWNNENDSTASRHLSVHNSQQFLFLETLSPILHQPLSSSFKIFGIYFFNEKFYWDYSIFYIIIAKIDAIYTSSIAKEIERN